MLSNPQKVLIGLSASSELQPGSWSSGTLHSSSAYRAKWEVMQDVTIRLARWVKSLSYGLGLHLHLLVDLRAPSPELYQPDHCKDSNVGGELQCGGRPKHLTGQCELHQLPPLSNLKPSIPT